MKHYKKISALLLAAVLAFAMIGCGSSAAPEDTAAEQFGAETEETGTEEDEESPEAAEPETTTDDEPAEAAEPEAADNESAETTEPETADDEPAEAPAKETEYKNGTTTVLADDGYYYYEFKFVDGELVFGDLESEEGKGGWGEGTGYDIEKCPFYGMTVEEIKEKLENDNYSVTIQSAE